MSDKALISPQTLPRLSGKTPAVRSKDATRCKSMLQKQLDSKPRTQSRLKRGQSIMLASHQPILRVIREKSLQTLPYENFIKELKMVLPTPRDKFLQFMQIPPFNRLSNHIDLIGHFLGKMAFFRQHDVAALAYFARKVRLTNKDELDDKFLAIVQRGECFYSNRRIKAGQLVTRRVFAADKLICEAHCVFVTLMRHQYKVYVNGFVAEKQELWTEFIKSVATFKTFNKATLDKLKDNLSIHYFLKGETVFQAGDQVNDLYIIFSGKVSRKVVVEVDKVNKIPRQKYSKIQKTVRKSYEYRIEFQRQDIVGVAQILEGVERRNYQIEVAEHSVLLSIDKAALEEALDDFVRDRLRKYNLKKYPQNYDQLCHNYVKEKEELRRNEERKIAALKAELAGVGNELHREKITSIIRIFQNNIRENQNRNLLERRLSQRYVQRSG